MADRHSFLNLIPTEINLEILKHIPSLPDLAAFIEAEYAMKRTYEHYPRAVIAHLMAEPRASGFENFVTQLGIIRFPRVAFLADYKKRELIEEHMGMYSNGSESDIFMGTYSKTTLHQSWNISHFRGESSLISEVEHIPDSDAYTQTSPRSSICDGNHRDQRETKIVPPSYQEIQSLQKQHYDFDGLVNDLLHKKTCRCEGPTSWATCQWLLPACAHKSHCVRDVADDWIDSTSTATTDYYDRIKEKTRGVFYSFQLLRRAFPDRPGNPLFDCSQKQRITKTYHMDGLAQVHNYVYQLYENMFLQMETDAVQLVESLEHEYRKGQDAGSWLDGVDPWDFMPYMIGKEREAFVNSLCSFGFEPLLVFLREDKSFFRSFVLNNFKLIGQNLPCLEPAHTCVTSRCKHDFEWERVCEGKACLPPHRAKVQPEKSIHPNHGEFAVQCGGVPPNSVVVNDYAIQRRLSQTGLYIPKGMIWKAPESMLFEIFWKVKDHIPQAAIETQTLVG